MIEENDDGDDESNREKWSNLLVPTWCLYL